MIRKFFWPISAPHALGTNIARSFFGTQAEAGGGEQELGDVNLHYGILYGGQRLHERCKAEKRHFVHVDHAFWGRTDDLNSDQKGHFRFSLDSQANILRRPPSVQDHVRLKAFEKDGIINFRPRRKAGKWVMYQPPSQHMRDYWALPDDFDAKILNALRRKHSFVRLHAKGQRLDFDDVKLFVSFNSAAGFRALELGVDAMMSFPITPWPFEDLSDDDWLTRRQEVFAYMAGRTFSFPEMRDGTAFFHMTRNGEIP